MLPSSQHFTPKLKSSPLAKQTCLFTFLHHVAVSPGDIIAAFVSHQPDTWYSTGTLLDFRTGLILLAILHTTLEQVFIAKKIVVKFTEFSFL
jgi:hypothetical protein